jgi:two-component system, NtrC family, sensor kinase
MAATPDNAAPDPQQIIAELQRKLDESRAELVARNSAYSERIAYQAAANDVLKVMSASPGNPQPVFDLIVERARDLCDGYGATVYEFDGTLIHWRAATGVSDNPSARQVVATMYPMRPTREWPAGRAIIDRQIIHISDLEIEPGLTPALQGLTVKSAVLVPMMRGSLPIGAVSLGSRERGGFADTQIELLKTFAEQAVIAITSAETYRELQERTRDLQDSLQFQTATAEVLRVIASSPTDVKPVLDAIVESACRLCEASDAYVALKDGGDLVFQTHHGSIPVAWKRRQINRQWPAGRTVVDGRFVHLRDVLAGEGDEFPDGREIARSDGARSVLTVPLMREGEGVGVIILRRTEVQPFTDKQIALLKTFADQAVIAIGNVHLFEEVQAKTRDLSETLEFQTASSEVLKVISQSPDALQPVLDVIAKTSQKLCEADAATIFLLSGVRLVVAAVSGASPAHLKSLLANPPSMNDPGFVLARVAREKLTVNLTNVMDDAELAIGITGRAGSRALLTVPLLRNGDFVGAISLRRSHLTPFTPRQVEAVETFADQAVIAISNVNLFEQVQQRTRELSKSLEDLRTTQDRLVQTEKLASLGQLTAGIAHEIKNPLNFVNNFSALSVELVNEMNDVLEPAKLDDKTREELDEIRELLKGNLEKVVQHGKRADSIVKNMLLHSRSRSGEHRPVEINAVIEESLNLAYHGARAEGKDFNITIERVFDPLVGVADIYPQEITRVLLNLISNGFYAATQRAAAVGNGFEPRLMAVTRDLGDRVEVRIRDNGTGIPPDIQEKIFNPFFTTKPAGEGTGLGLSISHDIVVKQHGGTIEVVTEPGSFTEFVIKLPRVMPAQAEPGGQEIEHLHPCGR